jgi:hypothetical protein
MVPVQQEAGRSRRVEKKAKTKIPGRAKLRKEEDMVVEGQESLKGHKKGAEPETGAGF